MANMPAATMDLPVNHVSTIGSRLHVTVYIIVILLGNLLQPVSLKVQSTVNGKQCSYTLVVNEISESARCPIVRRHRRHKSYAQSRLYAKPDPPKLAGDDWRAQQAQQDLRSLEKKMHNVEVKMFDEIVRNRELNTTLTRHDILLQRAENLLIEYQKNFTNLFKTLMFMEQKLQRQREINRNLDHKLSNVMIDVAEVNYVLEKKVPSENSNLESKEVEVQSVSKVRSCGITDDKARFKDCKAVFDRGHTKSGVYYITPSTAACPIPVWCDMDTPPGGWLTLQRRYDGSVNFKRDWDGYKHGFGNVVSEYWLGNDNIFLLTNQDKYELRFDLWDFEGNRVYAKYSTFKIDGERDDYTVHVNGYEGSAADSFQKHDGMLFSTQDHDNDEWKEYHCAREWEGGWWYKNCWFAFLNGPYYNKSDVRYRGISWNDWKHEQLRRSEIKIRPSSGVTVTEPTSTSTAKP